jgi:hypothetical protein
VLPRRAKRPFLTIPLADGLYECAVNSATADEVVADDGGTIDPGAQIDIAAIGNGVISPGTVFTAISNRRAV